MTVLALDTTSRHRAVVVLATRSGAPVGSRALAGGRLDTRLAAVLAEFAAPDLEAVVVATGPGSYTGVRTGMAAALAMAHTRGIPLHGAGSLEVVAAAAELDAPVWIAVDAGRQAVYAARCARRGGRVVCGAPERLSAAELADRAGAEPVASADPLGIAGARAVDPVAALAAAVPQALSRPPLALAGLTATYIA